jgi:hypothetical protein
MTPKDPKVALSGLKSNDAQRLGYDLVAPKSVGIFPPKTKPLYKIKDFRQGNPPQWIIGIVRQRFYFRNA